MPASGVEPSHGTHEPEAGDPAVMARKGYGVAAEAENRFRCESHCLQVLVTHLTCGLPRGRQQLRSRPDRRHSASQPEDEYFAAATD